MTNSNSSLGSFNFSTNSFVAGIILGALLAGAYFLERDIVQLPSLSTQNTASNATSTDSNLEVSGAVSVINQSDGQEVIIESLTVPPPGVWVAVREVHGGTLGNVLGAERVDGPRSSFPVSLLRATEPNRSYAVQLYRNDGDGSFDLTKNSVYVDFDTGDPVIVYFATTN